MHCGIPSVVKSAFRNLLEQPWQCFQGRRLTRFWNRSNKTMFFRCGHRSPSGGRFAWCYIYLQWKEKWYSTEFFSSTSFSYSTVYICVVGEEWMSGVRHKQRSPSGANCLIVLCLPCSLHPQWSSMMKASSLIAVISRNLFSLSEEVIRI